MKIYRMQERPDDAVRFIFRELCDANYPSEKEFENLKAQLKQLTVEKERRKLRESIENDQHQTEEEIEKILNEKFRKFLNAKEATSLLKDHLTEKMFDKLKDQKTTLGGSLLDNIQSGLTVLNQEVGLFASDANAYHTFSELFEKVLDDLHETSEEIEVKQENPVQLKDLDPEKLIVKSIKLSCNRSFTEFPFVNTASSQQLTEISEKIVDVLDSIEDKEIEGIFEDYQDIEEDQRKLWQDEGILFKEPDEEYQTAAKTNRLWPHARGIFLNEDKTVRVWINHQEHMMVISTENSANLKVIYDRMKKLLGFFKKDEFAHEEKYGFLAHNLKLVGIGLEISAVVKIPQLMKEEHAENFATIVDKKFFATENLGRGYVRLSTTTRLGISEEKLCEKFQLKIIDIIAAEKCLYKKKDFVFEPTVVEKPQTEPEPEKPEPEKNDSDGKPEQKNDDHKQDDEEKKNEGEKKDDEEKKNDEDAEKKKNDNGTPIKTEDEGEKDPNANPE